MTAIACLVNTFLRRSEGFIYEQVINTKKYDVEILARDYINPEQFPYKNVNPPKLHLILDGLMAYLRHF